MRFLASLAVLILSVVPASAASVVSSFTPGAGLSYSAGSLLVPGGGITGAMLASGAATTNLGYTPLNPSNNLSDILNAATARANLALGAASTVTFGSITGTPISGSTGSFTTLTASGATTFPSNVKFTVGGTLNVYASTTGSDSGNSCLVSGSPCTAQGAVNAAAQYDLGGGNVQVNLAAGTYDTSLLVGGGLRGMAAGGSINGGQLIIAGPGSGTATINPTVGGGGCAQNYGDGITISAYMSVQLAGDLTIGTTCSGRSGVFLQNWAYLNISSTSTNVQWASATVDMVHVEANAYFELPGASSFNIASGATAGDALNFGTYGLINIDGGTISFNGNATFSTAFAVGGSNGLMQWLTGTTVNLNAHTVTGAQYNLSKGALFYNASTATVPGSTGTETDGACFTTSSVANCAYNTNTGYEIAGNQVIAPSGSYIAYGGSSGATSNPDIKIGYSGDTSIYYQSGAHKFSYSNGTIEAYIDNTGVSLGSTPVLTFASTAPTVASGGCIGGGGNVVLANGTVAFQITLGSSACSSTIALTMPTAHDGWVCDAHDVTTPASNAVDMTAENTTSVTLTNYVRTTGVAGNFAASDVIAVKCAGY